MNRRTQDLTGDMFIGSIITLIGLLFIGIYAGPIVAAGVLVAMWGNNIQHL